MFAVYGCSRNLKGLSSNRWKWKSFNRDDELNSVIILFFILEFTISVNKFKSSFNRNYLVVSKFELLLRQNNVSSASIYQSTANRILRGVIVCHLLKCMSWCIFHCLTSNSQC